MKISSKIVYRPQGISCFPHCVDTARLYEPGLALLQEGQARHKW
jgi:hypothetical protein